MAQGQLGSLEVKLKAEIREYLSNMTKAEKAAASLERQVNARFNAIQRETAKAAKEADKFYNSINKGFGSLGKGLALGGITAMAGTFGAISLAVNTAATNMDKLRDRTLQLKVGSKELQEFDYAARQSGIGVGEMDGAIIKMQKNISSGKDIFKLLGLDTSKLAGMGLTGQLEVLSEAYQKLGSDADKTAFQIEVFGKSGSKTSELLTSNIKDLAKEFEAMGVTLTDSQLALADAFGDNKAKLDTYWDGFVNIATAEALPVINDILKAVIQFTSESGGVASVAKSFGQGMADMAKSVAGALADIGEQLKEVGKLANKVAHPIDTTSKALGDLADRNFFGFGMTDAYDPNAGTEFEGYANPGSKTTDPSTPWDKFKANISKAGTPSDFEIPSAAKAFKDAAAKGAASLAQLAAAAKENEKAFQKLKTKLDNNFFSKAEKDKENNTAGKSYLDSLNLDKAKKDTYHNKDFDDNLKEVYNKVGAGQTIGSLEMANLIRQASYARMVGGEKGMDTTGIDAALKEVRDFIDGKDKLKEKQQVDVNITLDKEKFLQAAVTHKLFKEGVTKYGDEQMAEEATKSGIR